MALLHTPAPKNNFQAPDFTLKNIDGKMLSLNDVKGENGTVLAFICNHCPYVHAIITRFVHDMRNLQDHGVGVACIMPNDTVNYPEDNFENMQAFAAKHNFNFPYLLDETQSVAKTYEAICTPDIFGFNANAGLQYRGRLDSAGPKDADDQTTKDLVNAMHQIIQSGNGPTEQFSSMGCSIKWK